jgi:hypothetical protein
MIAGPGAQIQAKNTASTSSAIAPASGSFSVEKSPRNKPPAKPSQLTTKRATATSGSKTPKLRTKAAKRPPQPSGFEWRKNGAGWDLRKVVWIDDATSGKKRKRPYLGHLSKSAFGELKRKHKGAALERAIAQWIAEHDR